LLEWYRYDLQGTPTFYNSLNVQIPASSYSVRHLFTGQQWHKEAGIYDLRFRAYSPDIGRFLQPDPISFQGDRTNLYRYVGNNPQNRRDPSGLLGPFKIDAGSEQEAEAPGEVVYGSDPDCSEADSGYGGSGYTEMHEFDSQDHDNGGTNASTDRWNADARREIERLRAPDKVNANGTQLPSAGGPFSSPTPPVFPTPTPTPTPTPEPTPGINLLFEWLGSPAGQELFREYMRGFL
jgi:RHS repeat-associated protein